MSYTLDFLHKQVYDSRETGVAINATLRSNDLEVNCLAKIDSGSEVCLFERGIAEAIGIDVEGGYSRLFSTLTGNLTAFGHEVETLGLRLQSFVYFPELHSIRRNLLGRHGWLQLVKLALVDYDSTLYLSPHDQ